ncbi:hypothetical protein Zmor_006140 [Zophobas morio]|uniref:Uncharacterized protein n=1 Tax=Zophobas morio TaxID=2755281 RepID=A0AA38IR78_9CUCU|nr:hypothetical protein Zmor_006140 [Zophobas morio]
MVHIALQHHNRFLPGDLDTHSILPSNYHFHYFRSHILNLLFIIRFNHTQQIIRIRHTRYPPLFRLEDQCSGLNANVSYNPNLSTNVFCNPVDTTMYGLPNCTLMLLEGPLFVIIEIMDSVRF